MNVKRTIWIARIGALLIIFLFAILMLNLYQRLTVLQSQNPPAATQPER